MLKVISEMLGMVQYSDSEGVARRRHDGVGLWSGIEGDGWTSAFTEAVVWK